MKRLIIFSEFSTPVGYGVYNRHHEIAKAIQAYGVETKIVIASNHHFQSKTYDNQKLFEWNNFNGIDTFIIKSLPYKTASSKWRVVNWFLYLLLIFIYQRKILSKDSILLFSSPSPINFLFGIYRKLFFGNKIIFELRDIWPLTLVKLGGYSNSNPLIRTLSWIEKMALSRGDFIISTLPNANLRFKEVLGYDRNNFYCIPQGLNTMRFANPEPIDEAFIKTYIPDGKFIVCYAGTIGLSNALETIIKVSKSLESNTDILFLFVGEGAYKDEFQNLTKDQKNVSFAPFIDKSKVQSLLRRVDVVYDSVHNSDLYKYGLSRNKWMDYLFAGKPLIFSGPNSVSILKEANCGYIVEPENSYDLENKILEVSKMDKQELLSIGSNGREYVLTNRSYERLGADLIENVLHKLWFSG